VSRLDRLISEPHHIRRKWAVDGFHLYLVPVISR
jgi:hypothetical protein